jgi:predicted RNase H-like nuclease (RuvC/YqgF family)
MSYKTMSTADAVIAFLEDHAPAKPKAIVGTTGKTPNQVYASLYQLKKAGRVKRLGVKGWTVVHGTAKTKAKPEQNTVRQYDEDLGDMARKLAVSLLKEEHRGMQLKAIINYLEERNETLQEEVRQLRHDLEQYVSRQGE